MAEGGERGGYFTGAEFRAGRLKGSEDSGDDDMITGEGT